jgi:hypothetical protein
MAKYTDVQITRFDNGYAKGFHFSDLGVGDFFRITPDENGNLFVKISINNAPNTMAIIHKDFGCGSLSTEIGSLRVYPVKEVVISVSN